MSLIARLRSASRGQLWAALLSLLAANLAIAAHIVAYVPVVRLQPICYPAGYDSSVELDGEMAVPFFHAYHDMINVPHMVRGRRIYVTFGDWWEFDWLANMSHKATANLLAERVGRSAGEVRDQVLGIPEFDEVARGWPPCGALRKLAIEGGEWNYGKFELKPEIARGRPVPLPHLTDPLLFEPVRPREPEAADGKGDAEPR